MYICRVPTYSRVTTVSCSVRAVSVSVSVFVFVSCQPAQPAQPSQPSQLDGYSRLPREFNLLGPISYICKVEYVCTYIRRDTVCT